MTILSSNNTINQNLRINQKAQAISNNKIRTMNSLQSTKISTMNSISSNTTINQKALLGSTMKNPRVSINHRLMRGTTKAKKFMINLNMMITAATTITSWVTTVVKTTPKVVMTIMVLKPLVSLALMMTTTLNSSLLGRSTHRIVRLLRYRRALHPA